MEGGCNELIGYLFCGVCGWSGEGRGWGRGGGGTRRGLRSGGC